MHVLLHTYIRNTNPPQAFSEVAFKQPLNVPSQPFKSPHGWHIGWGVWTSDIVYLYKCLLSHSFHSVHIAFYVPPQLTS